MSAGASWYFGMSRMNFTGAGTECGDQPAGHGSQGCIPDADSGEPDTEYLSHGGIPAVSGESTPDPRAVLTN